MKGPRGIKIRSGNCGFLYSKRRNLSIHVGEERQITGSFDCHGKATLVVGAEAGFAPGIDLGLCTYKLADGL